MHSLTIILKKDLWSIKNYFLQIKNNPKRLILIFLYVAWFGYMIVINNDNELQSQTFDLYFTNGITLFMIILTIIVNTKNIVSNMSNAFHMADVNLLFTSAVDSRVILLASFLKKLVMTMLTSVFILFFFFSRSSGASLSGRAMAMGLFGYISFAFILEPLNFIMLKLSKKVDIRLLQVIFIGFFVVPLIAIGIIEGDLLQILISEKVHIIPLYGWSKALIMSVFTGNTSSVEFYFVLQTFLLISVTAIAVFMATDYYEDVLISSERTSLLRKEVKEGRRKKSGISFFGRKAASIEDKNVGHKALFWKSKQEQVKIDLHYLFGLQTFGLLILSTALTIFISYNRDFYWIPFAVNGAYAYFILLIAMSNKNTDEYDHPYFFIVPGTFSEKLFQCHKLQLIRFAINTLALNLPFSFISDAGPLLMVMITICLNMMYWNLTLSNLVIKMFFKNPIDYAMSLIIRKLLQILILILPSVVAIIAVTFVSEESYAILGALLLVNLFIDSVLLILSGYLASRMEYYG